MTSLRMYFPALFWLFWPIFGGHFAHLVKIGRFWLVFDYSQCGQRELQRDNGLSGSKGPEFRKNRPLKRSIFAVFGLIF